jgi:hypothetical protein
MNIDQFQRVLWINNEQNLLQGQIKPKSPQVPFQGSLFLAKFR